MLQEIPDEDKSPLLSTDIENGGSATDTRPKLARSIIYWLQGVKIPQKYSNNNSNNEPVYLVQGLDKVFLHSNTCCAESVTVCNKHVPRYLWYMLSGFICDIIQFQIDLFLRFIIGVTDPSACWFLGFAASIYFRHITHRYFVFGDYVGGYYNSLLKMYAGYSVILVLSTIFNVVVTHYLGIPHYISWILTLLWTGVANYFILKKLWSVASSGGIVQRVKLLFNKHRNSTDMTE